MKIKSIVAVSVLIMIIGVGAISQASPVFAESSESTTKDANVISLWDVTIENEKAILWAKVKNTGSEPLDSNCKVHFWVRGPDKWIDDYVGSRSCTVNDAGEDTGPVSPGESRWYKYEWTIPNNAKPGTYRYWVIVKEGDDKISEWSSGKDFTITAKTQSAKGVELGKIEPTEAFQIVTLKAKVKNTGDTTLDSGCEVWFWVEGKGIEDHI
ncbi:MAG: hypothetical protein IMF19_04340, partial [Proteobacteria bacterium]|nr:hypothetical protein [Pseudomonadota bacterium]